MPVRMPKLQHVRFVRAKGKTYAYFDTGRKKPNGRPIYIPLPPIGSVGFYDSYAAMKGARGRAQTFVYTVHDLAREYQKSDAFLSLAAKSQQVYVYTIRRIIDLMGEYPVNDVTRRDVQGFLDKDIDGAGAHNMFLAVLGVIYKWGRNREKTDLKPTDGIERRRTGEHEPWPDNIVETALKSKDANIRLAVHLLLFTGQRIGDVLQMRWSDIRDDVIEVKQQKTGKTLWIPFLDELRDELARTPKKGLTIIAGHRGQRRSDQPVRLELQAFTRKLGAETVPHGLRKNAVNAFLEAGSTVAETASITGQSYKIVEYYAKRINQRGMAKAAVLKLETKRKSQAAKQK